MENFFKRNLVYLKDKFDETYGSIGLQVGVSANTVANWIERNNEPKMSQLEIIAQIFEISLVDLMYSDLSDVNLNFGQDGGKNTENVNLNVNQPVNLNAKKGAKTAPIDQSATLLEDSLTPPQSEQNLVETMATAIRGLERANARLEQLVERLEEENRRLKSEIPSIGKDLEAGNARAS